jgi:poly(hydroxyalkanoate) depolymerase family esterase
MTSLNTVASSPDMLEATRLTREGRLAEASALLQRLFRGEAAPAEQPAAGPSRGTASATAGRRAPRIFDVEPETGETTPDAGPSSLAGKARRAGAGKWPAGGMGRMAAPRMPQMPEMPEALRGFLDKLNQGGLEQPGIGGLPGLSPAHAPDPVPEGAQFTTRSFSNEAGTRSYKLYVPSTLRDGQQPAPLVVMLHGCTQSPDDFAAGTKMNALAEERGFLVAYPAQPPSANAQKCWNWFKPGDQQRGQGEPALLAGITRQVMRDHAVDPRRVYVAGLSAGGAAAAIMGTAYPDLYAAVGVHSGLACGAASDVPSAFAAMGGRGGTAAPRRSTGGPATEEPARVVPTIVFHADRDTTVHPSNGDQVLAQAGAASNGGLRATVERGQVPGGRAYSRTLHADAAGGPAVLEQWVVHGGGHAWSGGSPAGSYTDPRGPDASREMLRFFLDHPHPAQRG